MEATRSGIRADIENHLLALVPAEGRIHTMKLTAIFTPAEEGGYVIACHEYPVTTQGETREEALDNLKEAISLYLEKFDVVQFELSA